ncbi:hypothetical protein LINGRAHAP2_LOCUS27965 [Linum grandiflorum]
MVVMFLFTIGHNHKNSILRLLLCRYGETIHSMLHKVLQAIVNLHHTLLKQPKPIPENSIDMEILQVQNCLGALDDTHVKLRVRAEDQVRYRDRNGDLLMSVLGVCNPNMEFIYVLARWEGSAHDGRVLRDALLRPNRLVVPRGTTL